jgi:hypothetical protein
MAEWFCVRCGQGRPLGEEPPLPVPLCPRCQEPLQLRTIDSQQPDSKEVPELPVEPKLSVVERESIFTESGNEALLGEADVPEVEMPPVASSAPAEAQLSGASDPTLSIPQPDAPLLPDPALGPGAAELVFQAQGEVAALTGAGEAEAGSEISEEQLLAAAPRRLASRRGRGGLFLVLVVIPLISYSILATIALIILYLRAQETPSPFEYLPDLQGDFQGASHEKQGSTYQRLQPDSPLPARLQVNLGQSITLGDVEVTPDRVELRPIQIVSAGLRPIEPPGPVLALYLRFRNTSTDCLFCPTDPYFERRWKADAAPGSKPYTFLEVGEQRFYGGPLAWQPGQQPNERERVQGQEYRMLRPSEAMTTFVCTDPDDRVPAKLADYQGELLWRVQVRRGLVRRGEREAPATAVVGVRFKAAAIHKS